MSGDLIQSDARRLADLIRRRAASPVEVMRAHLERVESVNPVINAVVVLNEAALDQAREAERAVMSGEPLRELHGVPFTAKDVFDTAGVRSARGSLLYAGRVPDADSTAARRLKEAGAILLGKTNCPEFALSAETLNDLYGRTRNPWNPDRTSGGSSGGEAAAVSAGLSPLGIGTDLGGSNRLPSHYCNVVGLKPTHGLIPLTGSWPELMSRRMHVGPIARTVGDARAALAAMSGPDGVDPYAIATAALGAAPLGAWPRPPRVGMMPQGPFEPVMEEIQEAVRRAGTALEDMGCVVEEVDLDWRDRMPIDFTMTLLAAESRRYFEPFIRGREHELSDSIAGLLELPTPSLGEYLAAMDDHEAACRDVTRILADHDLLLCPTSPVTAPAHDSAELCVRGQTVPAGHAANITAAFGMSGNPAVSVPFGMSSEGLPIGAQLAARPFEDALLLSCAEALEAASDTAGLRPPIGMIPAPDTRSPARKA